MKKGDTVITKIKNRWNLDCAAKVTKVNEDGTLDLTVWNMGGPGADGFITNVPPSEVKLDCKHDYSGATYSQAVCKKCGNVENY